MGIWNGDWTALLLLSGAMFVFSILLAEILIVRMPVDYLTRDHPPESNFFGQLSLRRRFVWLIKNVAGLLIFIAGLIMLLTPGQGLLFLFLGASLVDFPHKQIVLRRLLGHRRVLDAINRIRARAGRPPVDLPP